MLTRCCSTLSIASKSSFPFPFKHISKNLTIASGSANNCVIFFSRAAHSYAAASASMEEESSDPSLFLNTTPEEEVSPAPASKATLPVHEFSEMNLSEPVQKAIAEVFKFKDMSAVQHQVLSTMPTNKDMLVRAKTGTGKTLAFLLTAVEKLRLHGPTEFNAIERGQRGVSILIISPTRELAMQIANEAKKLTKFMPFATVLLVGGESKNEQLRKIDTRCDIIVGTPGRLNDILESSRHSAKAFMDTKVLILDEADRLLEMGFKEEIEKIVQCIPKKHETLLFSATVNDQTRAIAARTLNPSYLTIDCIPKDEVDSHLLIRQSYVMSPFSQQLPLLLDILQKNRQTHPNGSKVIVFLPTANLVQFLAQSFNRLPNMEVLEIHSRLTQSSRVRVSDKFRKAKCGVLFTSDVSARGVDYPGVSLVVQIGAPSDRDQYIHRVGRTGRAGTSGEAMILLTPFERTFLTKVNDLPIKQDLRFNGALSASNVENVNDLNRVVSKAPRSESIQCFTSWCGYARGAFAKMQVSGQVFTRAAEEFAVSVLQLEAHHVKSIVERAASGGPRGGGGRGGGAGFRVHGDGGGSRGNSYDRDSRGGRSSFGQSKSYGDDSGSSFGRSNSFGSDAGSSYRGNLTGTRFNGRSDESAPRHNDRARSGGFERSGAGGRDGSSYGGSRISAGLGRTQGGRSDRSEYIPEYKGRGERR